MEHVPRLVAWEFTRKCNLRCRHCRAPVPGVKPGPLRPGRDRPGGRAAHELTTGESLDLVDQIAEFAPLTLILSGGEPLVRSDLLEMVRHAVRRGLRVAVATNGTLVDEGAARALRSAGVSRASLSLDGPDAATHDARRGLRGAYDMVRSAAARLREAGLPFQINTTVTTSNVDRLPEIVAIVPGLGAIEHHMFMFVPTGRGARTPGESLSAERCEEALRWLARAEETSPIPIRTTCAPHSRRIVDETGRAKGSQRGGGCLAGTAFAFVSSEGRVFPCGYLPLAAGDVRTTTFAEIWRGAPLFASLRDRSRLSGRCGACEYRQECGGCRARAYAISGQVFGEEPCCTHEPAAGGGSGRSSPTPRAPAAAEA